MTVGALLTLVFFLIVFGLVIRRVKSPHSKSATGSSPVQSNYKPTGTDATLTVLATSGILAASASRESASGAESGDLASQNSTADHSTTSAVNPATELPMESESGMDESFFDPFDIDW